MAFFINRKAHAQTSSRDVYFTESAEDFPNPERGFSHDVDFVIGASGNSDYSWVHSDGTTLGHAYIRLDNYKSSLIPSTVLSSLDNYFSHIRQAKLKVIPRVTYNFSEGDADASQYFINQHLAQLKPIISKYQDVIYVWQIGYVGAWGEWHTSSNFNAGTDGNGADIATLKAVNQNILDSLPAGMMAEMRYPAFRMQFYNQKITSSTAFDGSYLSRSGFHNDCFLSSTNDEGTYNVTGMTVFAVKQYFADETRYTPMTGETCSTGRVSCTAALAELSSMHWSALNMDFDTNAINILKNQGCYNEIHRRLGYRFVLKKLTLPSQINSASAFNLHMELVNQGYAPIYNARTVYVVFESKTTGSKTPVVVSGADPRRWLPASEMPTITVDSSIPTTNLTADSYKLYLWLPDSFSTIQAVPEYALRLANTNIWNATTGYNYLTDVDLVASDQTLLTPTGFLTSTLLLSPTVFQSPTSLLKAADGNGDGSVDQTDYLIWFNHYGLGVTQTGGPSMGDFNNDSFVDGLDYYIWMKNYGK